MRLDYSGKNTKISEKRKVQINWELKGHNDILTLIRPEIIYDIHKQCSKTDADIVKTNTFSGTWIAQADYNLESLNNDTVDEETKLAKKTTEDVLRSTRKKKYVARIKGQTNGTLSILPSAEVPDFKNITVEDLVYTYAAQARAILDSLCYSTFCRGR